MLTHTTQSQTEHDLREAARVPRPNGIFVSTRFMFEKRDLPELSFARLGLKVIRAEPPAIHGFLWLLHVAHVGNGSPRVDLPLDTVPFGRLPPPVVKVRSMRPS